MRQALLAAAFVALAGLPARAAKYGASESRTLGEDEAFNAASAAFQDPARDKSSIVSVLETFVSQFGDSPRAADARFLIGEAYMQQGLDLLKAEVSGKKAKSGKPMGAKNPAVVKALDEARRAFAAVAGDKRSGLGASAQYRLGEAAYDAGDWADAEVEFKKVEKDHAKSYIVGEALLGVVYADLALEQFNNAEASLFLLGETYPTYMREPAVLYAQGIVALHKGDYPNAERALKLVKSAEAQYYLGKTYLLSKRAYLAAAAFENLIRDYPDSELKEEAHFFIGDSFFLAEDYDGAVSKYQRFIALFPESPLRVSATFRIGSSYFQKRDFVEARANFQAVVDRYPKDFFAPLAQFLIAESYLTAGQVRDALFAYTKVITQYPETIKISPLAHYKLGWTQLQVGDYLQAVQTSENFLRLYPSNAFNKNVYLIMGNALIALKRHTEAVAAFQRIIDLAPASEIAEQALFSILQNQYNQKAYNSILTSYQYIFRHLPPSRSKWRSLSYLYAAEAYLALNQVDEAKLIYDMILKVYPDEVAAFYAQDGLAWTYAYKGEDQRALDERQKLKEMLAAVPSTFSFTGLNELGIADSMFNQKNYDDAYQFYDKFAKENPQAPEAPGALYRAGMSLYHQRYYTQAIETWKRLIEQYPNAKETPQAAYQAADTLFRAQKYPGAVAAYQDIIKAYPKSEQLPLAYLRIAQSAFNTKDDARAMEEVRGLVGKFPRASEATDALDLMEAVFDRSKALDFKTSIRSMISANESSPIAGELQFRLARRCFEAKDFAGAAAEFQKFSVEHTNHQDLPKAQFYLGESFFNQNAFADAVPAFERLLNNFEKSDDTALALFHLASSYYGLKKYDDAVKYYTRLMEEYPGSEYAQATQFNLALAYKALGKTDMAQYTYQRYVQTAGSSDQSAQAALWEIFTIQKERKDLDGALGTLEQIRAAVPPGGEPALEVAYRRGELYQAMGRPDEALNSWDGMRAMKPLNSPYRLQALIKLGELYEKVSDWPRAIAVYEDLARNGGKDIGGPAGQRALALRRMHKAGPAKGQEPGVDEAQSEEPPAEPAGPQKKKAPAKKSNKAAKAGAPAKPPAKKSLNLPGMESNEQIQ